MAGGFPRRQVVRDCHLFGNIPSGVPRYLLQPAVSPDLKSRSTNPQYPAAWPSFRDSEAPR